MNNTFKAFSHKISNSLDSNELKHLTAEQVDKMVDSIKPNFKSKQNTKQINDNYFYQENVVVDDFGFIHGPYESDNLLIDEKAEPDYYDDFTDLYTDKEHSSIGTNSSNQTETERTSDFSKELASLRHDANTSNFKHYNKAEIEMSFNKIEVELHKYETILEKDFLTRFNEQMYKDDVILATLDNILGSGVFIKFDYLKNILEWNDVSVQSRAINTKRVSINFQDTSVFHLISLDKNDELVPVKNFRSFVDERIQSRRLLRKQNSTNLRKIFSIKKDMSDPDDYIINKDRISSKVHSIVRRSPSKKLAKSTKIIPSIEKLEKKRLESENKEKDMVKRALTTSDKSSAEKSETSMILRQRSLKRAFEASTKGSSTDLDNRKPKNYENLKSTVSLLELYASDVENPNNDTISLINGDDSSKLNSPRLPPTYDSYNPISDSLSSKGMEWQNWENSVNYTDGMTQSQNTVNSLTSDTENNFPLTISAKSSVLVPSDLQSRGRSFSFKRWRSPSRDSAEILGIGEPPVLSKPMKNTDKPLLKQLTEKLIKNRKTKITEDPLKPILPSTLQNNELEREFRFTSGLETIDADDEYNTKSSEMMENYAGHTAPVLNETSSIYGTQSVTVSSMSSNISKATKRELEHHKHAKEDTIEKIQNIGTIPEVPISRGRSMYIQQSNDDMQFYNRSKTPKNASSKKSTFRFSDHYLNLIYDEDGRKNGSLDPFS